MPDSAYSFGPFRLDPADRRLTRDGAPIDVSARYLDALILLVTENGHLVTKDRFMDEVWRGVPVTDEALTQCIRALRKALGDDAASPRFIETVPRHGYRLIAPVGSNAFRPEITARVAVLPLLLDSLSAALGGGIAGIAGGLGYLALGLVTPGIGTASTLLALISVNLLLGFVGGGAVGAGAALGERIGGGRIWLVSAGGAAGGLLVGSAAKMIGHDLFALFFGRDPGSTTGAIEGLVLGGATGLALIFASRAGPGSISRCALTGLAIGGAAGALMAFAGGRLMAGSLAELATRFPESNLQMDGAMFGEEGLGPVALTVATACEAALFAACVVAAVMLGRRMRTIK